MLPVALRRVSGAYTMRLDSAMAPPDRECGEKSGATSEGTGRTEPPPTSKWVGAAAVLAWEEQGMGKPVKANENVHT